MEGLNLKNFKRGGGIQDFKSIFWTPQETHQRDYRLGFGNQHQPPGCSMDIMWIVNMISMS